MIGKTLSHYKVLEKIGQGGMGEVYRAEDTNLSREVAIKVLPEQFTQDPQRLSRNGRELFYRNGNKIMAVDIQVQPTFSSGKPRLLFETSASIFTHTQGAFDVTPDGQRFLMIKLSDQELPATQLTVVLNWFSELKRLVPTDK